MTSQGAPEAGAWKTVPVEPTDAMVKSGLAAHSIAAGFGEPWEVQIGDIYRAMLAASPSPPPGVGELLKEAEEALREARDLADCAFGENQPSRAWAKEVRASLDTLLARLGAAP